MDEKQNDSKKVNPVSGDSIPFSGSLPPDIPRTIPVVEQQVHITKEVVESGKVLITKSLHEVQEMVNMPISYEEHNIERIAFNKIIDSAPPAIRHEGETMIIPITREELVVQKRLILVEEIHVTKRRVTKNIKEPVTLLKEKLTVEHIPNPNPFKTSPPASE